MSRNDADEFGYLPDEFNEEVYLGRDEQLFDSESRDLSDRLATAESELDACKDLLAECAKQLREQCDAHVRPGTTVGKLLRRIEARLS